MNFRKGRTMKKDTIMIEALAALAENLCLKSGWAHEAIKERLTELAGGDHQLVTAALELLNQWYGGKD